MRSQHRTIVKVFSAAFALVWVAGAAGGCAAKVRQDVFDQTIADLRGDLTELDSRVSDNDARIAQHEEALAALRSDLETLAADFGELQAQITEIENGLRFAMPVHFEFDRAEIRPVDRPALDRFAEVAGRYYPAAVVTVEGFADPAGSVAYNMQLSERRARNVARYLSEEGGLDSSSIRVAAYGEDRQVIPGAQGPGRRGLENRRVTFVIEFGGELQKMEETVASTGSTGA